ncbi:hypothetical protein Tco_0926880 [Tanacetum coccineum]|uniref:Uncharacterized protein n=1 Tax=Tanacetum coccineum TaxID=301880 RepID=A0ABQ5DB28_9ASTR
MVSEPEGSSNTTIHVHPSFKNQTCVFLLKETQPWMPIEEERLSYLVYDKKKDFKEEDIKILKIKEINNLTGYVARDNEAPSHAPKRRAPKRRAPKRALNAENLQPKEVEINPHPDFHMSETEEAVSPLTQTEAQETAAPLIPPQPGVQSQPRDVLLKKIAGLSVNLDKIREVEGGFYSKTPDKIFANKPFALKNKYLAMALRSVKNNGKKVYNRKVAAGGSWEGKGKGIQPDLRAKKTVVVAEKAKTDMEKKLLVLRSLERAEGDISSTDGSGSSGSDDAHGAADAGSGLNRLAAAAAARDAAAMSRAEDGATLQLNDDDDEEEGRPTYEHVSSDDDT